MNNQKLVGIYARVSTDRQAVDMQLAELRDYTQKRQWTVYQEYIDQGYTGKNTQRPAFTRMLEDARKRKYDVLLVWKLDRLARSLKDLITTIAELEALNIDFISFSNQIDTSTPAGRLTFHIIGAMAEFERDIISDRVKAGLKNARRKGKRLGRPPINQETLEKARGLKAEGYSNRAIEKKLGISREVIRKFTKEK